jgi:glycerophosphoryl diester phosphodiesterase
MLIIAHRGAAAAAPENTLSAFREAIREGADLVEMDLRLSRDGEVVVIHDRVLDRTSDGIGPVGERTREELKKLDAGSWFSPQFSGERIPTLAETLNLFGQTRTGLCLEMKIDRGEENSRGKLVREVLKILETAPIPGRVFLASFDLPALRLVRARKPEVPTGLIFREEAVWDRLERGELEGIDLLSARWDIVTASRVAAGRRAGREIWAWTVDRPEELARVRAAGVDGAASNNPAWLQEELARMG